MFVNRPWLQLPIRFYFILWDGEGEGQKAGNSNFATFLRKLKLHHLKKISQSTMGEYIKMCRPRLCKMHFWTWIWKQKWFWAYKVGFFNGPTSPILCQWNTNGVITTHTLIPQQSTKDQRVILLFLWPLMNRGNKKFEPIDGTWSELSSYGTGPMRFASGIAVRQRSASVL